MMEAEQQKEGPYEMESAENKHARRVRSFWNWSLGTVIAGIIAFFPVNKAYDDYHTRLAKEAVSPQITKLQEVLEETKDTGAKSASQIDFLVKAEAGRMVDALATKLVLLRSQAKTSQIEREIFETELRMQKATVYRDCIIAERPNCDALRVW